MNESESLLFPQAWDKGNRIHLEDEITQQLIQVCSPRSFHKTLQMNEIFHLNVHTVCVAYMFCITVKLQGLPFSPMFSELRLDVTIFWFYIDHVIKRFHKLHFMCGKRNRCMAWWWNGRKKICTELHFVAGSHTSDLVQEELKPTAEARTESGPCLSWPRSFWLIVWNLLLHSGTISYLRYGKL